MNAARFSRLAHQWLALAVGIQLWLWAASGFYMVVLDLDFIHGDRLVRSLKPGLDVSRQFASFDSLRRGRSDINAIRLRALPDDGSAVHEIVTAASIELVGARTGHRMSSLPEARVIELARVYYAGTGEVVHALLIDVPDTANAAAATVDRFFAALSAGNLERAGSELDPAVMILESGGARPGLAGNSPGSRAGAISMCSRMVNA